MMTFHQIYKKTLIRISNVYICVISCSFMSPRRRKYELGGYDRLYITLPRNTKRKLERISNREHRSLSNMIVHMIEEYPEQQ